MRKSLLSAVLALVMLAPAGAQSVDTIADAHRSLVQVSASFIDEETKKPSWMFCSGVQIGISRVLTAEHCVNRDNTNTFVSELPARVVKKNDWLVLIDIEPNGNRLMKLAKANPKLGEQLTTIGFVDAAGTRLTLRRAMAGSHGDAKMFFLDSPIVKGMSGGPVINDRGELVAINQASNAFTGLVSDLESIREFLK